jgi:hypothetical protein
MPLQQDTVDSFNATAEAFSRSKFRSIELELPLQFEMQSSCCMIEGRCCTGYGALSLSRVRYFSAGFL